MFDNKRYLDLCQRVAHLEYVLKMVSSGVVQNGPPNYADLADTMGWYSDSTPKQLGRKLDALVGALGMECVKVPTIPSFYDVRKKTKD